MFMIIYSVFISLAFGAALFWYLQKFVLDGFSLRGTPALTYTAPVTIALCILNGFAVYFGWTIYFVIIAAAFCVAQILMLETRSKLAFYLLIAGQVPAALVSIAHDVQNGQWNWLNWFFALLLFPLIEIAAYNLATFVSAENDNPDKS